MAGQQSPNADKIISGDLSCPSFNAVKKHWDDYHKVYAARILPGQYYVTTGDEMVSTVLGSCIAACIRDKKLGIGGMNHFMLPEGAEVSPTGAATRYGVYAMEHLINDIIKLGGKKHHLEVKLFGGGKIVEGMTDIGQQNIRFVRDFLATEGLKVAAEDVGLVYPRKVNYFPSSGRALVKRLRSIHANTITAEEKRYSAGLKTEPVKPDIELFD